MISTSAPSSLRTVRAAISTPTTSSSHIPQESASVPKYFQVSMKTFVDLRNHTLNERQLHLQLTSVLEVDQFLRMMKWKSGKGFLGHPNPGINTRCKLLHSIDLSLLLLRNLGESSTNKHYTQHDIGIINMTKFSVLIHILNKYCTNLKHIEIPSVDSPIKLFLLPLSNIIHTLTLWDTHQSANLVFGDKNWSNLHTLSLANSNLLPKIKSILSKTIQNLIIIDNAEPNVHFKIDDNIDIDSTSDDSNQDVKDVLSELKKQFIEKWKKLQLLQIGYLSDHFHRHYKGFHWVISRLVIDIISAHVNLYIGATWTNLKELVIGKIANNSTVKIYQPPALNTIYIDRLEGYLFIQVFDQIIDFKIRENSTTAKASVVHKDALVRLKFNPKRRNDEPYTTSEEFADKLYFPYHVDRSLLAPSAKEEASAATS